MKSNTYRRGQMASRTPRSKWELTYATIAARLMRKGNINVQNAFSVAKFLGAFVYLYSFPYSFVKKAQVHRKIHKKIATANAA